MGSRQEHWFYNELSKSSDRGAAWRIIGNQILFSRIYESYGLSGDNWSVSRSCHEKFLEEHSTNLVRRDTLRTAIVR